MELWDRSLGALHLSLTLVTDTQLTPFYLFSIFQSNFGNIFSIKVIGRNQNIALRNTNIQSYNNEKGTLSRDSSRLTSKAKHRRYMMAYHPSGKKVLFPSSGDQGFLTWMEGGERLRKFVPNTIFRTFCVSLTIGSQVPRLWRLGQVIWTEPTYFQVPRLGQVGWQDYSDTQDLESNKIVYIFILLSKKIFLGSGAGAQWQGTGLTYIWLWFALLQIHKYFRNQNIYQLLPHQTITLMTFRDVFP